MDNSYAEASMAIRRPINEVFEAFINPDVTTKFWFTDASDSLEENRSVNWIWSMYNLTVPVHVLKIKQNAMIKIEWGEGEQKSTVIWDFKVVANNITFVSIKNFNFLGTGSELISQIRDSTGGFTMVLCGLKAYLEHGLELNLVGDRWPLEMR